MATLMFGKWGDAMRAPQVLNRGQAQVLMQQVADKFNFQQSVAEWMVERRAFPAYGHEQRRDPDQDHQSSA